MGEGLKVFSNFHFLVSGSQSPRSILLNYSFQRGIDSHNIINMSRTLLLISLSRPKLYREMEQKAVYMVWLFHLVCVPLKPESWQPPELFSGIWGSKDFEATVGADGAPQPPLETINISCKSAPKPLIFKTRLHITWNSLKHLCSRGWS